MSHTLCWSVGSTITLEIEGATSMLVSHNGLFTFFFVLMVLFFSLIGSKFTKLF